MAPTAQDTGTRLRSLCDADGGVGAFFSAHRLDESGLPSLVCSRPARD